MHSNRNPSVFWFVAFVMELAVYKRAIFVEFRF